jgi:hypothetical protein
LPPHHPTPHPAAMARDTYPLYPWLLSRHGRIFPHRFPAGTCSVIAKGPGGLRPRPLPKRPSLAQARGTPKLQRWLVCYQYFVHLCTSLGL